MRALEAEAAASLGHIWSALHRGVELEVRDSEVHYLRMLALAADDDAVSHLLLRKLRLAKVIGTGPAEPARVFMNSFVEYRFDGGPLMFCQLVHPSSHAPSYGVSVTSRLGAGLVGLAAGQIVLWPDSGGRLCDLHVVRVENSPGLDRWFGGDRTRGRVDA